MVSRKSAPAPILVEKDRSSSYSSQTSARSFDSVTSNGTDSASGGIPRRNQNVYTHCGRHTNQFLFGGHSFTEMARSVFKRDN